MRLGKAGVALAIQYESVRLKIDDKAIASGDLGTVIEPVWWTADIYNGPEEYELSLLPFSRPQRLLFALQWYFSEVNNGGHHQFYSNSTGIVWKDTLAAFQALKLPKFVDILQRSAALLGGNPSLNCQERNVQLDELEADFDELDKLFYSAQEKAKLDAKIAKYIREHAADFYFDGTVRRAVIQPTKMARDIVRSFDGNDPCPQCGKPLRSNRAKQCFECGADWHMKTD